MMNRKFKREQYIFILVSVIIILILYEVYYQLELKIDNFPLLAFIISVVSSILASLIFSVLDDYFFKTKQDELIERLTYSTSVLESMSSKGIVKLQYRNEIDDDYWKNFIINANGALILSGKTLYRWIRFEELKIVFREYLIKKIKSGCHITFVIYKEEKLNAEDKREREKFQTFLFEEVFCDIYRKGQSVKGSLTIKETTVLPYFFITNGVESVVMPYFANVSNDKNLAFILRSNNRLNHTYLEDYQKIIMNSDDNIWVEKYKKEYIK